MPCTDEPLARTAKEFQKCFFQHAFEYVSLHVLWLRYQNLSSANFWGFGGPKLHTKCSSLQKWSRAPMSFMGSVLRILGLSLRPRKNFSEQGTENQEIWNCEHAKIGKRGFHFPLLQKRASWVKKSPFLYRAPHGKWGFPDSKRPFLEWGDMVFFFLLWNPLFPILGVLIPVQGQTHSQIWNLNPQSG